MKHTFKYLAKPIPYYKELKVLTGSLASALLFTQLEYWFSTRDGDPFYKYLSKAPEGTAGYRDGDSWTEELEISSAVFRKAFGLIGVAYLSKTAYMKESEPFKGKYYCSYFNKLTHKTHYFRNHDLVDKTFQTLANSLLNAKEKNISVSQQIEPR